jgi:putative toxin-antitoxin system antitoxin component (TIGR02293 family)
MSTATAEMILGLEPGGEGLVKAVRSGLPVSSFSAVAGYTQLTRETLARAAGIPLRTVQRRTASSRLKRDESDRLARVARIYALAETVLGSRQAAEQWMLSPNWSLDGARPVDQIDTEVAGREVEDSLGRIDNGTFA